MEVCGMDSTGMEVSAAETLRDGFHRKSACVRDGSAMSVTEVRDGSLREARDGSLREVRDGSLREARDGRRRAGSATSVTGVRDGSPACWNRREGGVPSPPLSTEGWREGSRDGSRGLRKLRDA